MDRKRYGRRKPERKQEVSEPVRRSPVAKKQTLAERGLSAWTDSRGQRRYRQQGEVGLEDRGPRPGVIGKRLRPAEEPASLQTALAEPDHSPREIACWITDPAGFGVWESTGYRVLKRHGLIGEVKGEGFSGRQGVSEQDHAAEGTVAR